MIPIERISPLVELRNFTKDANELWFLLEGPTFYSTSYVVAPCTCTRSDGGLLKNSTQYVRKIIFIVYFQISGLLQ